MIYLSRRGDDVTFETLFMFETTGTEEVSTGVAFKPQVYLSELFTISAEVSYQYYREWLLWDFDIEQLASYQAHSYFADVRLDWYPSTRQEVRLKFQWVGIKAAAIDGYQLDHRGDLVSSATPSSDFSLSDTALQIRYRYQLAPLSDIFLVYSRGGFFGSEDTDKGAWDLLQKGWQDTAVESIIAKVRYRF